MKKINGMFAVKKGKLFVWYWKTWVDSGHDFDPNYDYNSDSASDWYSQLIEEL